MHIIDCKIHDDYDFNSLTEETGIPPHMEAVKI